jgi:hypothetical protein
MGQVYPLRSREFFPHVRSRGGSQMNRRWSMCVSIIPRVGVGERGGMVHNAVDGRS